MPFEMLPPQPNIVSHRILWCPCEGGVGEVRKAELIHRIQQETQKLIHSKQNTKDGHCYG